MAAAKMPSPKTVNKAEFVRMFPHLTAREIVAKATEQGIKIGEPYVYNVRAYDKKHHTQRAAARRAPSVARPITTTAAAEDLLKAVAAEIGLGHALDVLQAERAKVQSVLRR
jgi:hypothetical protein